MRIDAPHDLVAAPVPAPPLLLELLPLLPQPAMASAPSAAVARITCPLIVTASIFHILRCFGAKWSQARLPAGQASGPRGTLRAYPPPSLPYPLRAPPTLPP